MRPQSTKSTGNVRLEAIVYGRVQGVSFRYYTQREAQRLDVTGWVANRRDGTVQVVAEGPQPQLDRLEAFLHIGPSHARVDRVDATWLPATGEFSHFQVRML